MMRSRAAVLVLVGALLAAASPASFTARVVRVIDGDSLEVSTDTGKSHEKVQIRLFGIDSPERGQPYSRQARAELSRLVKGKTVRLEVRDHDDYGRTVARVYAGDVDVNLALVREGAAWVYRKYSKDKALLEAEANARRARRGLWAQSDGQGEPIPPWEWRHRKSAASSVAPVAPVAPETPRAAKSEPACGSKHYCREMTSCAEARFYLEQCGLRRLDGDGDGVPCEAICRGE